MKYIGVIHQEGKNYGLSFPDFPGCIAVGKSLDEVHEQAEEALLFHIKGMREDGEALPNASSLEAVLASDFAKGSRTVMTVALPGKKPAPTRINIILDDYLIQKIDEISNNRSAFLAEAARHELAAREPFRRVASDFRDGVPSKIRPATAPIQMEPANDRGPKAQRKQPARKRKRA